MNTFRIVLKEFKQQIRDWKANSLIVLFPIILIAILGVALSGAFSGMSSLPEIKVLYTLKGAEPLGSAFLRLVGHAGTTPIQFAEAGSQERGLQAVKSAEYVAFVVVGNRQITLYGNERRPVEAGVVKSILTAFLLRYNATAVAMRATESSAAISQGEQPSQSYVATYSVIGKRAPSSTDFYAVTMITLIIMYSALFGAMRTRSERTLGTGNRVLCAPVGRLRFLTGKVVGSLFALVVQAALLVAFSHYVLGAYWGTHLLTVAVVIFAEAIMIVSVGVGVAYLLPSEGATAAALNSLIPFFALFGGTYVPAELMGPTFEKIGAFSPLSWINQALLGVIYSDDFSAVGHAVIISCAVGALFIAAAAILSRREAYR